MTLTKLRTRVDERKGKSWDAKHEDICAKRFGHCRASKGEIVDRVEMMLAQNRLDCANIGQESSAIFGGVCDGLVDKHVQRTPFVATAMEQGRAQCLQLHRVILYTERKLPICIPEPNRKHRLRQRL